MKSIYMSSIDDFSWLGEDEMLFSEHEVAERLRIKPSSLRNERLHGAISFVKIRRRYFYTEEQIAEYIKSKTVAASLTMSRSVVTHPPREEYTRSKQQYSGPEASPGQKARQEAIMRLAHETFKRGPRSPNRR